MGEKVHFWSDKPNDWHSSSRGDADKHADAEGGTATQIDSIAKLQSVFRAMLGFNATLDQVDLQFMTEAAGKTPADLQNRPPFIHRLEFLTKEFALRSDAPKKPPLSKAGPRK